MYNMISRKSIGCVKINSGKTNFTLISMINCFHCFMITHVTVLKFTNQGVF